MLGLQEPKDRDVDLNLSTPKPLNPNIFNMLKSQSSVQQSSVAVALTPHRFGHLHNLRPLRV